MLDADAEVEAQPLVQEVGLVAEYGADGQFVGAPSAPQWLQGGERPGDRRADHGAQVELHRIGGPGSRGMRLS